MAIFRKIVGFFTGANKKEAAERAEQQLIAEQAERERQLIKEKELAIARRRGAPSIPPRNMQSINRSKRESKPVEVREYNAAQEYRGSTTDNTSLMMMAAMVALDDTPSRSYSHSNSYHSSSTYESSGSSDSSSSSCSGGCGGE